MCVVSMIIDHYNEEWPKRIPNAVPLPYIPPVQGIPYSPISQAEIDEFRKLLERAREYDKRNNEPNCELEEKKEALLRLAKVLGIEINFL